jgi:hypothetical protein
MGNIAVAGAVFDPKAGNTKLQSRFASQDLPNFVVEIHKINNLQLAVSNGGTFGIGFAGSYVDPETGQPAPSCEYPAESDVTYLYYGAFWAGAIVGRDTLVSIGIADFYDVREFWPPAGPEGAMIRRSNMKSSNDYSDDAVSEQDFVCVYSDTFASISQTGTDPIDNRPHIPLGLEIQQRSFGWSYEYAEDFLIFDYTIKNISRYPLRQFYFAVFVDADVYHESHSSGSSYTDDICGYLNDIPAPNAPGFKDTIRIAWTADNDGDPNSNNDFDYTSATGLTGTSVLRTPNPDLLYSFNWWITNYGNPGLDWGPRMAGTEEKPFRDFGPRLGTPRGDRNKYYVMSSNEFDYNQLEAALNHTGAGWLATPREAADYADGFDARYLFSFGPFDLDPGDTLPITLAYVAGDNFHVVGTDFADYWDPLNPNAYRSRLDFSDLGKNAKWAKWIFDTPCYDTDGDGDSGKVRWIVDSTTMDSVPDCYEGDGVADFKGASPPPPPVITVTPGYGKLKVSWNGEYTENSVDAFSGLKDFEGYRLYYGQDNRSLDYVMLASYDRENFNIYSWDESLRRWNLSETPFSPDSLRALFGPRFDPVPYDGPERTFEYKGTYYYFTQQDWNASDLSDPYGIRRVYPNADLNDSADLTLEGNHRYYEYEYVIENIEPSRPYYVTVTAFDYGSRKHSLSSLESAPNLNAVYTYALPSTEEVESEALDVKVFPNPYRIDGGYAAAGYENRDRTRAAERTRAVTFFNLPKICTIRIYTISGDLVTVLKHYQPEGGPDAQQEVWNLISRNTQAIVTGIYLYHVKSEMGEQLGKLVIMK